MEHQQISPETKIKLENFLKEVESIDFSDSYDSIEETFYIKPCLIFEFLEENGYKVESDNFDYEYLVSYIFSKNNDNFDENDDSSTEEFRIILTINIMNFSCDMSNRDF